MEGRGPEVSGGVAGGGRSVRGAAAAGTGGDRRVDPWCPGERAGRPRTGWASCGAAVRPARPAGAARALRGCRWFRRPRARRGGPGFELLRSFRGCWAEPDPLVPTHGGVMGVTKRGSGGVGLPVPGVTGAGRCRWLWGNR